MPNLRFVVAFVAGTAACSAVAFFALRRPPLPAGTADSPQPAGLPIALEALADWCAPGYEPIPGGCLALSRAATAPQPLLIYLHGRYAHDATTEEVDRQRRLGATATARGFAVLALRGRLGECTSAELAHWYCWPSNEHNADTAGGVVTGWAGALKEARARARSKTQFVLGFSNGAYFAGLLATQGLLEAEAFVIAHGGPVDPVRAAKGMPPLLLLSADDDVAQDDMMRLDQELTRERWPHDNYARAGAHGLTDQDIEAALSFFLRAHEAMPLEPPLAMHRPAHHTHEAEHASAEAPAANAPGSPGEQPPL